MRSRFRTQVRRRSGSLSTFTLSFSIALSVALVLFLFITNARAQTEYPRMGLSASPDEYVNTIEIVPGEDFTLYACVFGPGPGEPVGQPFTSLSWVIHQVCCGATVDIRDFQFNPDLDNTGHPLVGVVTTTATCYDKDSVLLATITCNMNNPTPEGVLWAAGPFDASYDCQGGNALFMGMAVTINADGDALPVEESRWGSIKAMYR